MRKNILSLLSAIAIFCGCLFTFPHNAAASTYLNKDNSPVTDGRIIVEFKKVGGVSDDSCLMWVTDSPSEGNKRRWNTTLSMSATALRVKATDEKICDFKEGLEYCIVINEKVSSTDMPLCTVYVNGVEIKTVTDLSHQPGWQFIAVEYFTPTAVLAPDDVFDITPYTAKITSDNEFIKISENPSGIDGFSLKAESPEVYTASELVSSLNAENGASVQIVRDGTPLSDNELIATGDKVLVTSQNGRTVNTYNVSVKLPEFFDVHCSSSFDELTADGIFYSDTKTAAVKLFKYDGTEHSEDEEPVFSSSAKSNDDGTFSYSEKIPSDISGGKYSFCLFYTSEGIKKSLQQIVIICTPDSEDTKNLISEINEADSALKLTEVLKTDGNLTKLGIDADSIKCDEDFIGKYLFAMRSFETDKKFNFFSANETAVKACVVNELLNSGINGLSSAKKYIANYEEVLNALSEKQTSSLDSLLKKNDYERLPLSELFNEKVMLSKVISAEGRNELSEILDSNSDYFEINMDSGSDFHSIPSAHRYKVFAGIIKEKDSIETKSDVSALFNKYVKKALKEEKSSGSGSGSGSSSSTTISGGSNMLTPKPGNTEAALSPEKAAQTLIEKGILNGYEDGSLRLQNNVTRAEFAKMLATSFNIKAQGSAVFSDVYENDWFYEYVPSLSTTGIILGYNGFFRPSDNITREDAAVMISRTAKYASISVKAAKKEFSDSAEISSYAADAVAALSGSRILSFAETEFKPSALLTRGEAAVMICGLMNYSDGGTVK